MLDIERLLLTRIPDLASVYDGVRGRTLSSRHLEYVWKALKESGVRTVIDLRNNDKSERLPKLCKDNDMQYFNYPIDNSPEIIASMIENFLEFCHLIDEGDFYIACAMGLHRTDIALCIYWMFYGADKDVPHPQLHGYLREKGIRIDKMMRIINSFYNYYKEENGYEIIPTNVFCERKRIVAGAWENDTMSTYRNT